MSQQLQLEWAVASRALEGEIECGDFHVVRERPEGAVLAAIDGLGHGTQAAEASHAAARTVSEADTDDLGDLMARCDAALRPTRGAVMSIAYADHRARALTWTGIGNVEALLLRGDPVSKPKRESLLLFGGVVGGGIRTTRVSTLALHSGDMLVFATDGIKPGFIDGLDRFAPPLSVANDLLSSWRKTTDDALVLVARWSGG
jgi:negative regulator of sigma-B (phosphoserine phosphatase)